MNIDFNNPTHLFGFIIALPVFGYLYSEYIKKKRVKLLKKLGFTVKLKPNKLTVSLLCKLSPNIMAREPLPNGAVIIGNDPEVWWLATKKNKDFELYIFKINKYFSQPLGHGLKKEWIVITLKSVNDKVINPIHLNRSILPPNSFQAIENGISLVYRDMFLSSGKITTLINDILNYQKRQ